MEITAKAAEGNAKKEPAATGPGVCVFADCTRKCSRIEICTHTRKDYPAGEVGDCVFIPPKVIHASINPSEDDKESQLVGVVFFTKTTDHRDCGSWTSATLTPQRRACSTSPA
jgi:hypothetical protein